MAILDHHKILEKNATLLLVFSFLVVTIGGLMSGVPAKSMMAVTAISEGTVSTYSIIIWLLMLSGGVVIDYLLLPSVQKLAYNVNQLPLPQNDSGSSGCNAAFPAAALIALVPMIFFRKKK